MGHVACKAEMRNAYKIVIGKLERKRPLGRPKRRRTTFMKSHEKSKGLSQVTLEVILDRYGQSIYRGNIHQGF
jgi:hypothetical protein